MCIHLLYYLHKGVRDYLVSMTTRYDYCISSTTTTLSSNSTNYTHQGLDFLTEK